MARAVLIWLEVEDPRLFEVPDDGAILIGRDPASHVQLPDPRVSRSHARITGSSSAFRLEHLSQTNPTRLNGEIVAADALLTDKAAVELGHSKLVFHDLAAADQTRLRVYCGHCKRASDVERKECWYCGTSLVYASTAVTEHMPVTGRLIAIDPGDVLNLYPDHRWLITPDGELVLEPEDEKESAEKLEPAHIHWVDGRLVLVAEPSLGDVTLNGAAPSGEATLQTGDTLRIAGRRYLVVTR